VEALSNRARTEKAISSVLLASLRHSRAGEVLTVASACAEGSVCISVSNPGLSLTRADSQTKMQFALAEICIRSQGGKFFFAPVPFTVRMELPRRMQSPDAVQAGWQR